MLKSLLFWSFVCFMGCMAHVTFTNLKCGFKNQSYGVHDKCYIKAVNRTHKFLYIYARFYVKPLKQLTGTFKVLRNDHGYKPFFVDINFDMCKFLKERRNPILNLFFNTFRNVSNFNHTCPYDHDIIVDKLYTGNYEEAFLKYLPVPDGDYALSLIFYVKKLEFSSLTLYVRVTK